MRSNLLRIWAVAATLALIALVGILYTQQSPSPKGEVSLSTTTLSQSQQSFGQPHPANASLELTPPEVFGLAEGSVVSITARSTLGSSAQGSGFVYDSNGHIVTNNHVVQGSTGLEVSFTDGSIVKAKLVGADPYSDLAVIRVDLPTGKHDPLVMGDSSQLVVGQTILAIGNPFGLSASMSSGIVSQLGRQLRATGGFLIVGVIQIDAAVNPGNSGGPLLDLRARVVGVNTAIATDTGVFSGVGFAIPSNMVRRVVSGLIASGVYKHPYVGVSGVDVTPSIAEVVGLKDARGFLVAQVTPDGPAQKAGLKGGNRVQNVNGEQITLGGDVVVGIDDFRVRKIDDILLYLEENVTVGQSVVFHVLRDGKALDIRVVVGERPRAPS